MKALRRLLFENWFLKIVALGLATLLWVTIASESTSEIGIEVPLEYRNIPENSEIVGNSANTVEVRLRGPSRLIRDIQPQDISSTIDLTRITPGEKIIPLSPQSIRAPFGIEVVGVTPSRVRISVEPTITKVLPVIAVIAGKPAEGFRVAGTSVVPEMVEARGPAPRMAPLERIQTAPVDITGLRETVDTAVELDPAEPLIRIPQVGPVRVQVVIVPVK